MRPWRPAQSTSTQASTVAVTSASGPLAAGQAGRSAGKSTPGTVRSESARDRAVARPLSLVAATGVTGTEGRSRLAQRPRRPPSQCRY